MSEPKSPLPQDMITGSPVDKLRLARLASKISLFTSDEQVIIHSKRLLAECAIPLIPDEALDECEQALDMIMKHSSDYPQGVVSGSTVGPKIAFFMMEGQKLRDALGIFIRALAEIPEEQLIDMIDQTEAHASVEKSLQRLLSIFNRCFACSSELEWNATNWELQCNECGLDPSELAEILRLIGMLSQQPRLAAGFTCASFLANSSCILYGINILPILRATDAMGKLYNNYDPDTALDWLNSELFDYDDPTRLCHKAVSNQLMGDFDEAESMLKQGLAMVADNIPLKATCIYHQASLTLSRYEKMKETHTVPEREKMLDKAQGLAHKSEDIWIGLGVELGDESGYADTLLLLARISWLRGEHLEAMEQGCKAIDKQENVLSIIEIYLFNLLVCLSAPDQKKIVDETNWKISPMQLINFVTRPLLTSSSRLSFDEFWELLGECAPEFKNHLDTSFPHDGSRIDGVPLWDITEVPEIKDWFDAEYDPTSDNVGANGYSWYEFIIGEMERCTDLVSDIGILSRDLVTTCTYVAHLCNELGLLHQPIVRPPDAILTLHLFRQSTEES